MHMTFHTVLERVREENHRIFGVSLLAFLYNFSWAFVSPIFTIRVNDVLGDLFLTGVFISILYGVGLLVNLPFGYLCDRINTKRVIQAVLVVYVLLTLSYALVDDIPLFFAIRFVHAMAAAMIWISIWTYTRQVRGKRDHRGQEISVVTYSIDLANIIGPIIGGLLITYFFWQVAFYALSLGMALSLFIASIKLESPPPRKERVFPKFKQEFLDILKVKNLPLLATLVVIMEFIGALVWTFLPIILYKNGFTFFEIALFFAVTAFPALFMEFTIGRYVDEFGIRKAIIIGMLLNIVAIGLLAVSMHLYSIYISAIIGGFSWIFFKIAANTFATNMIVGKVEGMVSGFMMQFSDVGIFFGALAGGLLFTIYPVPVVFSICVGVLLLGSLLSVFLPKIVSVSEEKS